MGCQALALVAPLKADGSSGTTAKSWLTNSFCSNSLVNSLWHRGHMISSGKGVLGLFSSEICPFSSSPPSHLFVKGKEVARKSPKTLITGGLQDSPVPIREIALRGRVHNNKMERLNGEFRDREKVMRGLKTKDSPIITGYQLFHNFVRPHGALKGKTPAGVAGIKVEGENKWETLIRHSAFPRTRKRD